MKTENELRGIVANNIQTYRKMCGLTQLQLAEKLNYSDKSVSKWERGEALPDVYLMVQMAELFGTTVGVLLGEKEETKLTSRKTNKNIITLLSVCLVWVVATLVFVILLMLPQLHDYAWLSFIYAIPASFIVYLVFACVWKRRIHRFIGESGIIWTVPLAVCCQLQFKYSSWAIFLLAIPVELLALLWLFRKKKQKITKESK